MPEPYDEDPHFPLVLMACNCYIWVITPVFGVGRCKRCGVAPYERVEVENDNELFARPKPGRPRIR